MDRSEKTRLGVAGVSGETGFGPAFFDRPSFMDRGLNVRSSILYLRYVHDARVSYLAGAEPGGDRRGLRTPPDPPEADRWVTDPDGRVPPEAGRSQGRGGTNPPSR